MTSKELALSLIASSDATPQDLENLKADISAAIQKFAAPRQNLLQEAVADEEKFYDTVTDLIDVKWDSGILDAVDRPIIKAVVKGALKKLGIYEKIKQ